MDQRRYLGLCLLVSVIGIAGCLGSLPLGEEATADVDDPDTPPYASLPDAETIEETHAAQLAAVESATIRYTNTIQRDGTQLAETNRTTRVDASMDPPRRHVVTDDREVWIGGETNVSKRSDGSYTRFVERYADLDAPNLTDFDPSVFDGPEPIERDGETLYRYEASGPDLFADAVGESYPENVTVETATSTLDLRGDGLVVAHTTTLAVADDTGRIERTESFRLTDVGTTTVSRPAWYDEALAETDPRPDDRVTATETAPGRDATLAVTGRAADVSGEYAYWGLEPASSFGHELELAQVSCPVSARLPETYETAEITIEYESKHVPGGDEAGLVLMRFVAPGGTFTTVSDVDAAANTATATISDGGHYVVMHEPTYETAYRQGEEPADTAPPPTCE